MADDDAVADPTAERTPKGWWWVWQSPGGAYFRAPRPAKTRKAAIDAGKRWVAVWLRERLGD